MRSIPLRATAKFAYATLVMLVALLVLGVIGEASLRLYHLLWRGIPFFADAGSTSFGWLTLDATLGWRATENYRETSIGKTSKGAVYQVRRSQNNYGFRLFGNVRTTRMKVLVIGDSFTQAPEVSDDKTYYAILKNALGLEVFAYGTGGYGTFQELMVLDRFIDLVKPDLILWQYSANDFINNDADLERRSRINNNGLVRPYWVDNRSVHLFPRSRKQYARALITRYSRFIYVILNRIDRLRATVGGPTVEQEIEEHGFEHEGFRRSVQVTDDLMGRVRARAGHIPIASFGDIDKQPYTQALQQISTRHNIVFWGDIGELVRTRAAQGEDVLVWDGAHWNERGHQLVAGRIASRLAENPALLAASRQ